MVAMENRWTCFLLSSMLFLCFCCLYCYLLLHNSITCFMYMGSSIRHTSMQKVGISLHGGIHITYYMWFFHLFFHPYSCHIQLFHYSKTCNITLLHHIGAKWNPSLPPQNLNPTILTPQYYPIASTETLSHLYSNTQARTQNHRTQLVIRASTRSCFILFCLFSWASSLPLDLMSPGITTLDLAHIGGSTHSK